MLAGSPGSLWQGPELDFIISSKYILSDYIFYISLLRMESKFEINY